MLITPKISGDSIASQTQNNSSPAQRGSESQVSQTAAGVTGPSLPGALTIQSNVSAGGGPEAMDFDSDDLSAHGADHLMNSLRAGFLAQPGPAMLAQANLPSQSVYDLLQ